MHHTTVPMEKAHTPQLLAEIVRLIAQLVPEERIAPDTLAFHAQQAVEKALKALLVQRQFDFPRTHAIGMLLNLCRSAGYEGSEVVTQSAQRRSQPPRLRRIPSTIPNHLDHRYDGPPKLAGMPSESLDGLARSPHRLAFHALEEVAGPEQQQPAFVCLTLEHFVHSFAGSEERVVNPRIPSQFVGELQATSLQCS